MDSTSNGFNAKFGSSSGSRRGNSTSLLGLPNCPLREPRVMRSWGTIPYGMQQQELRDDYVPRE